MKRCKGCGDQWPDSARVCYTCGYRFEELGFTQGWDRNGQRSTRQAPRPPSWKFPPKEGERRTRTIVFSVAFGLTLAAAAACVLLLSDSFDLEGLAYAEATYALVAGLLVMKAVDYVYSIIEYRRSLANFGGLAEFVYKRVLVRSVRGVIIYSALTAACFIAMPVLGSDRGFVDIPQASAVAVTVLPAVFAVHHLAWLAYVIAVKNKGGLAMASKSITRAFDATRDFGIFAKALRLVRKDAGPSLSRRDEVAWQVEKYAYFGTFALAVVVAVRQAYAAEEGWAWKEAVFIAASLAVVLRLEHLVFRHREALETPSVARKTALRPLLGSSFKRAVPIAVGLAVVAVFGSIGEAMRDAGSVEGPALQLSLLILLALLLLLEALWMFDIYMLMRPPAVKKVRPALVEDVFLVDKSGNLLTHHGKQASPDMDDDIMMGMFTAIQDFMRESFGAKSGDKAFLNTLHYGDFKILIEHGEHAYIAMVMKGEETPELRNALKACVGNLHRKYGKILERWNGKADELDGVNVEVQRLIQEQRA